MVKIQRSKNFRKRKLGICILGDALDKEVQAYIQETRKVGGIVNARIAIACATGILRRRNSNLLAVNGGHVMLTKEWARYLLNRLGYVK